MRKKILIFFDGAHLAYSPTVTQLYDELSEGFDVTVLARDPSKVTNRKLPGRNVIYYDYRTGRVTYLYRILFRMLAMVDRTAKILRERDLGYNTYFFEYLLLKRILARNDYYRIIAVDLKNLFLCSLLKQRADFLSLELCENEHLLPYIDLAAISSILIQSRMRKEYLFKNAELRVFYVQNAPIYKDIPVHKRKEGLIFSGTAWDQFGFYHCLNYLERYPEEQLTVQGVLLDEDKQKVETQYPHLLREERLIINSSYFQNDKVAEYIASYEIGFCFYNFNIPRIDNFNYRTAPSGKLFKYLAAGVPVVGIDIPGFDFVREFECGVLIKDLSEDAIREAIISIRSRYDFFVKNAIKAAKYFSFDKAVKPYIDYIKSSN